MIDQDTGSPNVYDILNVLIEQKEPDTSTAFGKALWACLLKVMVKMLELLGA